MQLIKSGYLSAIAISQVSRKTYPELIALEAQYLEGDKSRGLECIGDCNLDRAKGRKALTQARRLMRRLADHIATHGLEGVLEAIARGLNTSAEP